MNRFISRCGRRSFGTQQLAGCEVVFKALQSEGIKDVFIYSGGAIMPLVDQFYDGGMRYYVSTHEQSSGHAATGYAKASDEVGVAIVTSGPGLTNIVTPILDAHTDSTPLVVLSGQVSTQMMGTDAFQECPAAQITDAATKWSYCVKNPNELKTVMEKAFRVAKDGKPGAVHIDLPKDVLVNPTRMTNQTWKSSAPIPKSNVGSLKAQQIDMEMVQQAADMINNSEQPVIILGKGVNDYPDTVANLVEASGAPVTTTIHAMGVFDEAHPLSLQMMGMHGFASANYALQSADCIINIGSRFDDRTTGSIKFYAPEAKRAFDEHRGGIIHCNIEPSEINKVLDTHINFACDGQVFMDALIPLLQHKPRQPWLDQIAAWKADFPIVIDPAPDGQIKQQDVIKEINHQVLESGLWKRTLYTSGVGNHQMYAAQLIEWKIPKSFITSGSLGVMGAGLPYAIGAQIAHPDHVVIDIDGDSSFNHTLSELKTVAEYNLPIKVAVLNDGHQSMVRVWEELFFNARYTATACAKNPNYALLAESYGLKSLVCDNLEDLPAVVNEFLTCKEPVVCDFRVLTDRCLPLVAPGMALHDMILHESQATKTVEMDLSQPPS